LPVSRASSAQGNGSATATATAPAAAAVTCMFAPNQMKNNRCGEPCRSEGGIGSIERRSICRLLV
jgi:hypothetical protein